MAKKSVKEKLAKAKAQGKTAFEPATTAGPDKNVAPVAKSTSSEKSATAAQGNGMLFHKENYILMGVGLLLITVGFMLMAGGKSPDPNVFAADELYSFRRITLAPILVLLGFAVEGYAILKKPKNVA